MGRVLYLLLTPGRPHEEYRLSSWCFQRLLGLCFLIAFVSLFVQLDGLMGPSGILPLADVFEKARPAVIQDLGARRFWLVPTLFWWLDPAWFHWICGTGIAAAALLLLGILPGPMLVLLWACSISFNSVGTILYRYFGETGWFLGYQWDALLLETGFLALLLVPWVPRRGARAPARGALWVLWWLAFRLMFASAAVKLAPFDPAQEAGNVWRALTALDFHYWTQPLPTVPGWYAAHLPLWFQKVSEMGMFAIEFGAPFFLFLPRRLRRAGGLALIALQLGILITGNYGFFNLLSIALCVLWLDDGVWRWCLPGALLRGLEGARPASAPASPPRRALWRPALLTLASVALLYSSAVEFFRQLSTVGPGAPGIARAASSALWLLTPGARVETAVATLGSLEVLNTYGLFSHMTVTRPEIVMEGSDDGATWKAYEFRYKMGDLARAPPWVQPHMPRLDWQMWFEALRWHRAPPSRWFQSFAHRLLESSPDVLGLLETNPFPDAPPRFLRAVLYLYTLPTLEEHRSAGCWWKRASQGLYLGPLSRSGKR